MQTNPEDSLRRDHLRPRPANAGLTADYQPPERTGAERPVLVARTPSGQTSELTFLLRQRLFFFSVLFAVLLGMIASIIFGGLLVGARTVPSVFLAYGVVALAACAVLCTLAAVLRKRATWTLEQLRVIELLFFGLLGATLLLRSYFLLWRTDTLAHAVELIGQKHHALAYRLVTSLNYEIHLPWALLIIAYGVFIPNRWRRCALVVTLKTVAPLGLRTAAYVTSGLPLEDWNNLAGTNGGFLLLIADAIAIFGAHRIEVLRQEALHARKLGQYYLKERLGGGGMGEVYLAEHALLRRPCAVKLIRPDRAGDAQLLKRFVREVRVTATLTHPNTIQVYDFGHADDGTFYYVMEYLPGLTLEQLVERHGPLPANRAIHFLRQVCGALIEAHAVGLIHRDIKPSNVMVCQRGGRHDTAKLLDFGLVAPLGGSPGDDKLTQEGAVTGTPAYMSPEQAGGHDAIDTRCDIYSLGALAYFLLTGEPPFAGRSGLKVLAAHMYEPPTPLSDRRPDVPAGLEAVVLKCLAKNGMDRYTDVSTLAAALAACDTGGPWTEDDAARWWQSHPAPEVTTGSNLGRL